MSDTTSRTCKCCQKAFMALNPYLEYCSPTCIETFFNIQQEELLGQKKVQMAALTGLANCCAICGKQIEAFTKRGAPKTVCSSACSIKAIRRDELIPRPCVHCDEMVMVSMAIRPYFVRCARHRVLWPQLKLDSEKNLRKTKTAEAPYDQYFLKGPWWDHKKKALTVLLMHSGASNKREMEFARYLLSVKEGRRLSDTTPIVYVDGDRSNVEISNLALG